MSFNKTFRLIDDVLSLDNLIFLILMYDIYPPALILNNTNITDTHVTFLGMNIREDEGHTLSMDIYDKRKEFGYNITYK